MAKRTVTLTYEVEFDEFGVGNGIDLARQMMAHALGILYHYQHGCDRCAAAMLAVLCDRAHHVLFVEELQGVERQGVFRADGVTHDQIDRHLRRCQTQADEILKAAGHSCDHERH